MRDQISNVQSTVGALRRGRGVLALAALLGLIAGGAYVLTQPPPLTSTTLVLLPTPAVAQSSTSDVETQVHIASSATVLSRAGQEVEPALPPRSVKKMVDITAPTNQLIQIAATSQNAAQAQAVSQAVADSYVSYVSNTAREVTAAALADLKVRRDELQDQIAQLQREITGTMKRQSAANPNSAEGRKEAQLLAGLRTQQADLSLQHDKVVDKIATGGDVAAAGAGTSVVQPATEARGLSTLVRLLVWAPLCAVVFTLVAAVALLLTARRDPRVRIRDEIADAVGSPVLAAVRSMPQRSVAGWSTLLETYEATSVESWAFRQILRGLVTEEPKRHLGSPGKLNHPKSLCILSLAGDQRGLAVAAQLAAFAASLGITTHLATAVGHESAASLWAASSAEQEAPLRPGLYVGDAPNGTAVDLLINVVVLDRQQPRIGDGAAEEAILLSVAAGTATEEELARVAVAVDDAGRRINGIVVADPDKTDRTSGRHTLEERSRRPALPTRVTGIAASPGTVKAPNRSRT
jgi:hypothetical protein